MIKKNELKQLLEDTIKWYKENEGAVLYTSYWLPRRYTRREVERSVIEYPELEPLLDIISEYQEHRLIKLGMRRQSGGDPYMIQFLLSKRHGYEEKAAKKSEGFNTVKGKVINKVMDTIKKQSKAVKEKKKDNLFEALAAEEDEEDEIE